MNTVKAFLVVMALMFFLSLHLVIFGLSLYFTIYGDDPIYRITALAVFVTILASIFGD